MLSVHRPLASRVVVADVPKSRAHPAEGSRSRRPAVGAFGRQASDVATTHSSSTSRSAWPLAAGIVTGALVATSGSGTKRGKASHRHASMELLQRKAVKERIQADITELETGVAVRNDIRNLAIIAHVDHGKTTLTDALMKQTGMKEVASMDSNDLEAERGITILAKNAAVNYKGVKVNLIDTPGHADFGGEVERILNMADGCLLLVDAQEGPMPQTKFVLRKALELKRRVLVCINKVDKPAARPDWVLDTTFDLFADLGADDELCDFPVSYASGINGKSSLDDPTQLEDTLMPLLDQVLAECPKPKIENDRPLQMMVSNLDYDDYKGRICIGRILSGSLKPGQQVGFQYGEDGNIRQATVSHLWAFNNNSRVEVDEIAAGDICAFSGMDDVQIGDSVVDIDNPLPLPPIVVEEPTVSMEFGVNVSPLAGQSGDKLTASEVKRRLDKETMTNLALRIEDGSSTEKFIVKGRGTLQLGILIENMRREGFELMISAPKVLSRKDPETGKEQEPYEELAVEAGVEFQGAIMEEMSKRGCVLESMDPGATSETMVFRFMAATGSLIGVAGRLLQRTKGTALTSSQFSHWGDKAAQARMRDRGSVVTMASGKATTYAIESAEKKADMFVRPGEEVYEGMCVGIHNKEQELIVNITKEKGVSNVRAGGAGVSTKGSTRSAMRMTLDDFLGHMDTDELLEVTPDQIRLCKTNSKALKR